MDSDKTEHKIPVTDEIYYAYYQPEWAEKARRSRESRCMISGKNGKTKRCTEDCSKCPHSRSGRPLSLEDIYERTEDTVSPDLRCTDVNSDPAECVVCKEKYAALYKAINNLSEQDHKILTLFMKKYSEAKIAEEVNMSQKGVNKRKQRIFEQLHKELKGIMC